MSLRLDEMETLPNLNEDTKRQKISGIFKCFQCDFKCSTAVDLKEHYQIHRSEYPFKCFQCGYDGKDAEDFKQHSLTHFEQSYYKCPKCNYKAKYKQNITSHVQYTHKQICECGIQFKFKQDFIQHLTDHPECKQIVSQNDNFEEFEEAPSPKRFKTENPPMENDLDEANSVNETKNDQVFVCQTCFYIFRSAEELEEHVRSHTRSMWLEQFNDDSEANSDSEFTSNVINETKFFLCGECHFIFSSRTELDKHLQRHSAIALGENDYSSVGIDDTTEEVEFVCYICDKAFGSEKAVKLHMGHHPAIKFRCPKCGLSMKSQASLKSHLATHPPISITKKNDHKKSSAVNIYKCASCSYQTKYHDNLQMHLTTHSQRDPSKRKIKPTFKVRFGRK